MKTKYLVSVLLALFALFTMGCPSLPVPTAKLAPKSIINTALDSIIFRDFSGYLDIKLDYLALKIRADGLKHNGTEWTYTWVEYSRGGVSGANIRIGDVPK